MRKTAAIDLTQGPISRRLWLFALPLMAGNLLQQCYNLVDTWVVGRWIGANALAAVGSSYTLMTFLTSLIFGLCLGSSAFFAMAWGQRDTERLRNGVAVSFLGIGTVALLLTILVSAGMEPILTLLQIPDALRQDSACYLRWIFAGIPAAFLYNYGANLLRGVGNAAVPLVFLAISTLLNMILDLVMVAGMGMGIAGAAQATLLAQVVSGVGLTLYILLKHRQLCPTRRNLHLQPGLLLEIGSLSGYTCLQQSVMNFGILMIQGLVNSFGATVMAAFAVAVKLDTLAYMPVQDFGNAFSTFVAQNHGAGQQQRIRRGIRAALLSVLVFCLCISTAVWILAPQLMGLFTDSSQTELIAVGVEYLRIEGAFYLGIGILFLLYGYYRAVARPRISLVLTVISLGTRVLLAYTCSPLLGVKAIWWAIPIGWFLADMAGYIIYRRSRKAAVSVP